MTTADSTLCTILYYYNIAHYIKLRPSPAVYSYSIASSANYPVDGDDGAVMMTVRQAISVT